MAMKVICDRCKGGGHDKNSYPVIKFAPVEQEDGSMKRQHTTVKQGSGCLKCQGVGHVRL